MICLKCLLGFPLEGFETEDRRGPHLGLHLDCFCSWFNIPQAAYFTNLARRSASSSQDLTDYSPPISFFHGKFKKYSAELGGVSYILKMREKEVGSELPEVEYLCNEIGRFLGVPVAEFYMVNFEGERVFVTKNFTKSKMSTDLQHIYHFVKNEAYSCKNLIKVVSEKTGKPYDVGVFIKTLLYDALIGNHDRHGRNLAFITAAGTSTLSPVYDNVSYLALEQGSMLKADFNPCGAISTAETTEPSMRDYVRELQGLGYKEEVSQFYRRIHMPKIEELISKSFCSQLMQAAVRTLIKKRYKEMEDELKH